MRWSGLWREAAWEALVGFYNSDDLTYAAAIAYYALVSLFPLLLLLFSWLGRLTADVSIRNIVLGFVLQYFPQQFDFIIQQIDAFRANPVTLGVAGTVLLVWVALGVFNAISTAGNYAWGVEETPGFFARKLVSVIMRVLGGSLVLTILLLVSASQVVGTGWFQQVLAGFPALMVLRSFTIRYATTLVFIVVVGLVFWVVPNTRVRFREVWPGALVTGVLWRLAVGGFSLFISGGGRMAMINGSLATVIVFLGWIYMQAAIFLYGVEFTAAYAAIKERRARDWLNTGQTGQVGRVGQVGKDRRAG